MKDFSAEMSKGIETRRERMVKRVKQIIRDRNIEIAVEINGSGIGRFDQDSITEEQLIAEAAEVSLRYRDDLLIALAHSSIKDEALAIYDAFVEGDDSQADLSEQLSNLILESYEHTAEVDAHTREVNEDYEIAKAELPGFLDAKILNNQSNRSVMSKWGSAKLTYENGDSSSLKTLLEDHLRSLDNDTERVTVERFLRYL